ncbi:MAG: RpiB/LacA/LacB family sugar-phosphate isomerase [Terriglobia bacterium]
MKTTVLTEEDVMRLPQGSPCYVLRGTIVTPSARERAAQRDVIIYECESNEELSDLRARNLCIAIGSDAGCREERCELLKFLGELGYHILDYADDPQETSESIEAGLRVAMALRTGEATRGIVLESTGSGSPILANKIPGVRAAHCYDRLSARNSRQWDDTNFLALSVESTSVEQMKLILSTWLGTAFDGGRHQARITRIEELEKELSRNCLIAIPGDCSCAL